MSCGRLKQLFFFSFDNHAFTFELNGLHSFCIIQLLELPEHIIPSTASQLTFINIECKVFTFGFLMALACNNRNTLQRFYVCMLVYVQMNVMYVPKCIFTKDTSVTKKQDRAEITP